jgi:hypothetical protein
MPISRAAALLALRKIAVTDLVMLMIPSPMIIKVNKPIRSTTGVWLKLVGQCLHVTATKAKASTKTIAYLVAYQS